MNMKEMVSLVKDRLTSEMSADQVGSYHYEIIKKWIMLVYDKYLQAVIEEAEAKNNYGILDSYTKTYKNVTVYYDPDRDEYYVDMPFVMYQFRRFNGIRLVCPMKDQSYAFIQRRNNSSFVMGNLEVNYVCNRPRFYIEGNNKMFFSNFDETFKKLMIKGIPTIDSLGEDEDIQLPAGKGMMIVAEASQMLLGRPRADQSDDNQSKTQPQ